jgi:hypothetical protein
VRRLRWRRADVYTLILSAATGAFAAAVLTAVAVYGGWLNSLTVM